MKRPVAELALVLAPLAGCFDTASPELGLGDLLYIPGAQYRPGAFPSISVCASTAIPSPIPPMQPRGAASHSHSPAIERRCSKPEADFSTTVSRSISLPSPISPSAPS